MLLKAVRASVTQSIVPSIDQAACCQGLSGSETITPELALATPGSDLRFAIRCIAATQQAR
jgi:hypothetical protein